MRRRAVLLIALLLSLATACASTPQPVPEAGSGNGGTADRAATAASLSDRDARDLAARVNAFGFDLLTELVAGGAPNVIISPVSVATLLAMVLAGADGRTAADMAATLHLDGPVVGAEHAGLLFTLTESADVTVQVANSLWVDGPMEPDYLDHVRTVFDATAEEVDLGEQVTADRIDEWVVEATRGLIDGIAADLGLPNDQALLALLNAVYFQGTWTVEFDPDATTDEPFTTATGEEVTVPLMHHGTRTDERFASAHADGFQLVRLPYGESGRFAMDIALPPPGAALASVVAGLDAAAWDALTSGLTLGSIHVSVPRLDLAYDVMLVDALSTLGMGAAFSGNADFTRMSPMNPFLSTVAHSTALIVDESGTEAAAVTGGVAAVSAPPVFRADRPFLFTITDTRTGALLFLGTITDPTA